MENIENLVNKELHPQHLNPSPDNPSLNNEVSKLSVVVRNFLDQKGNENSAIDGTLQLFLDKMQQLESAWGDNERRFAGLEADNEQLKLQLLNERTKCAVFQKRLHFIHENKGHFEKLKELYSRMKQMELNKNRSSINITKAPKSESDMTVSSYITCSVQPEESEIHTPVDSSSVVSVRKVELEKAQDTINVLKQLISRREQTWGVNRDKQTYYIHNVKRLEKENASLRSIVHTHYGHHKEHIGTSMDDVSRTSSVSVEVNTVTATESICTNTMDDSLNVMHGIIINLEKRNRELEILSGKLALQKNSNILSSKENEVVRKNHDLENISDKPSKLLSNILPTESTKEFAQPTQKRTAKSASAPMQKTLNRSSQVPPFPQCHTSPISAHLIPYPAHPRCFDPRCHSGSHGNIVGQSRNKRGGKPAKSGKGQVEILKVMRPECRGREDDSEIEMLKQIKHEITKKQQNINKKLEVFEGPDRKQRKCRSKSRTPIA